MSDGRCWDDFLEVREMPHKPLFPGSNFLIHENKYGNYVTELQNRDVWQRVKKNGLFDEGGSIYGINSYGFWL